MRYLTHVLDLSIRLGGLEYSTDDLGLVAYSECQPGGQSPSPLLDCWLRGILAGGPIFWRSKKQMIVALSTAKAEFMNLTPTGQALVWISNILKQATLPQAKPPIPFTGSMNPMAVALGDGFTPRTRHTDLQYKWVMDYRRKGAFSLKHGFGWHGRRRDDEAVGLGQACKFRPAIGFGAYLTRQIDISRLKRIPSSPFGQFASKNA